MRRILLLLNLLLFLFIVKSSYANLQAINIGAIKEWKTLEEEINYLWDNQGMYRHYQPTWSFPVTRESVIEKLETLLKKIDKLESKNKSNIDYYLLKGDIAHYLYNLDATKYYKPALAYYEKAKKIDKNDYRAYWFIGQHQCLSGHDIQGIDSYREIIVIAEPSSLHWAFWGDYSNCAAIGFMPFNQQMAFMHMFKNKGEFKKIEDEPSYGFYKKMKDSILEPDPDEKYENNKIWKKVSDREIYISVPLGIRIHSSDKWISKFTAFDKRINIAMIDTDSVKKNPEIRSRISIITYIPKKNDTKESIIAKYTSSIPSFKKISFKNKFGSTEIIEFMNPEVMKEYGGRRINMMFVERDEPEYPGVSVEYPLLNQTGSGVYTMEKVFSRFKGKVFYIILLESPDSIYKESFKTFTDFMNNNIILD